MRLRSDVPVGAYLSGGLDSTTILSYLRKNGVDLSTFSLTFSDESLNEEAYQKDVAEFFSTRHFSFRANFSAIAEVVDQGVGIAIMPARAAQRLQADYHFHTVQLRGAWANRKLLLATQDFNQLSLNYQQFAEFLLQHRPLSE
ncbi:MAG: hypothetical protein GY927_22905 [bacterium]|nr:hypothetical protein [bacterium]